MYIWGYSPGSNALVATQIEAEHKSLILQEYKKVIASDEYLKNPDEFVRDWMKKSETHREYQSSQKLGVLQMLKRDRQIQ